VCALFDISKLDELPLWAQVLLTSRTLRRAGRTLVPIMDAPAPEAGLIDAACDHLEMCAVHGALLGHGSEPLEAARLWLERTAGSGGGNAAARQAARTLERVLHWSVDGAGAAQGAQDFPVDGIVTADLARAVAELTQHPGIGALQASLMLAADAEQVAFACAQAHVQRYNGLGPDVLGRLTPVHALTLHPTRRPAEEQFR
jgi:hypothetical protein